MAQEEWKSGNRTSLASNFRQRGIHTLRQLPICYQEESAYLLSEFPVWGIRQNWPEGRESLEV